MSSEETKRPNKPFDFHGTWMPGPDPLLIGGKNYTSISNMIPGPNGLCGCLGYTKVASAQLSAAYRHAQSAIQLRTKDSLLSGVFVQAQNDAGTGSAILQQAATSSGDDVPNVNDFEITPVHIDASGASLGRFSTWPLNQIAYCNSQESLVYAGNEMYPAAFMIADSPMADALTNPVDYTAAVTNTLQTSGNICPIGNGADTYTKLLCPMAGSAGSNITDYSGSSHGNATKSGTADLSTAHAKFGSGSLATPAAGDYVCYNDNSDWDAPSGNKITYEIQQYLPSITNYLSSVAAVFTDNSPSADTISLPGDQTSLAWLAAGKCIGTSSAANPGPFKIAGISYSSGTGKTTITLDAADALTSGSATVTIGEALSCQGRYQDAGNRWHVCFISGLGYRFDCFSAGVNLSGHVNAHHVIGFNHVAVLCNGTDLYLAVNGNFQAASTGGALFPALAAPVNIGRTQRAASAYTESAGCYFAQWRISHINRWSADFVSPDTPYRTNALIWVVFTSRPIQSVKYYLTTLNSTPGAAITGKVWTGSAWSTLTITDETSGMTASGRKTSFASTVSTARPKLLEGKLFYVYQFEMSAGNADIYRVTVDAPMQPVRDLWDGVLWPVVDCRHYHSGVWVNDTMNVVEETAEGVTADAAYVASIGGLTSTEYIDIAVAARACAFKITMYTRDTGKVNTAVATLTPHYWNGVEFVPPDGQVELTSISGVTLAQNGFISWTPPSAGEEFQRTAFGNTYYYYRLVPSATLSATVWIDKIEAIPAPQLYNLAYKFPFMFQNRAMLCNLVSTGEGNRIDYALTSSTEGWNGDDSSFGDGKGSLYIGGQEELTCACEIYNRLGSSIYTFGLFFKANFTYILNGYDYDSYKDYPISSEIGCPAPLTLDTYQIFTSKEQQSSRNIAAWLSYRGPYMFDAGGLTPVPGIECYFEKTDARCINHAAIEAARGWFDPDLPQYNLQIPSGSGQTSNNVWLVYDFRENKWYLKAPSTAESPYLSAVARVASSTEKQYIYGFRENGYVMLLENGTTWDGAPIEQHVETGEILSENTIWDQIKMQLLKVVGLPLAAESVNLTVTIYKDGETAGTVIATIPLSGTNRFWKFNNKVNPGDCWSFRLRFSTQTNASLKGMQLIAWGCKYSPERTDNR